MHRSSARFTPQTSPEGALCLLSFQHQPSPTEGCPGTACGQRSHICRGPKRASLTPRLYPQSVCCPQTGLRRAVLGTICLKIPFRCNKLHHTKRFADGVTVGNFSYQRAEQGSPGQPLIHVCGHFLNVRILRDPCLSNENNISIHKAGPLFLFIKISETKIQIRAIILREKATAKLECISHKWGN